MFAHVDEDTAARVEALAKRLDLQPERVFEAAFSLMEWYLNTHDRGQQVVIFNEVEGTLAFPRLQLQRMTADGVDQPFALLPQER